MAINQQQGCATGDQLLRQLGELLVLLSRPYDTACREEADRFVLVLPNTSFEQAHCLLRPLLATLTEELNKITQVRLEASVLQVTHTSATHALSQLNALMQNQPFERLSDTRHAQLARG